MAGLSRAGGWPTCLQLVLPFLILLGGLPVSHTRIIWNRVFSNSFGREQRDQQAPEATTQNGDCTPHSSPWRNSCQIQPRRPSTRILVPFCPSCLNMGTRRFPTLPLMTSPVWAGPGASRERLSAQFSARLEEMLSLLPTKFLSAEPRKMPSPYPRASGF